MFAWIRRLRRRRLRKEPFPGSWEGHLRRRVPFYEAMNDAVRARFREQVKAFVSEKVFVGAVGQEIDEEVRVVIAAAAVRLTVNLDVSHYDRLTEIIVYPGAFRRPGEDQWVLGEAHSWGTVVLSWESVVQGLANPKDGHETAAHEFAHVLDRKDGAFDGTPELRARADYRPWADVMTRNYLALRSGSRRARKVLREYGATNEVEFFAVATEAYFEKPAQMQRHAPKLYAELDRFYRRDPLRKEAEADMNVSSDASGPT